MKRKNRKKSYKYLLYISCFCFLLVMGAMAAVSFTSVQSVRDLVRSTTTKSITELTVSKAQFLDEKIRSELQALRSFAADIGTFDDIFAHPELLEDYKESHEAARMWIIDVTGAYQDTGGMDKNFADKKELFREGLRGNEGVTDVFLGELGKQQVMFHTPIYKNDKVVGGLYEAYSVDLLQNAYSGATYNDAGYSYVLGTDGSIVLAPVRFSYLQIYSTIQDVLKDGGNDDEAIQKFSEALGKRASGTAVFDFEGEKQFLTFMPLTQKDDWYYVSVIPLSMVEKDGTVIIEHTVKMAVIITAAIALVVAAISAVLLLRSKKRRDYERYVQNINEAIAQNIDTSIFIVDGCTGRVEYAFENAEKILGIRPQVFEEDCCPVSGTFQSTLYDILKEKTDKKIVKSIPVYNDLLSRQMWLQIAELPVKLLGEDKYIFAITDVTHDRQIQENLNAAVAAAEHANASKSQFLSNMSHDIRTPMNAIVGMTKLAEINIDDRAKVKDCLYKIGISSKHLLELINDVLDMSKIESGKLILTSEAFSIKELFEKNIAIVQPQYQAKKQVFTADTQNIRHEYVLGDSLRLNQVLLNLLSNAGKFTPENGSITLTVEEFPQKHPGHAVYRITVADTGIGISAEFLPKIFQPFEREKKLHQNQVEGTGLGLVISKNIIEAMGGRIFVESHEGEGSVFTVEIELPLSQEADDEQHDRVMTQSVCDIFAGKRFLLVEDNELNREIASQLLEVYGAAVECASDGAEGVKAFEDKAEGYFDAIFMDIQMPVMNGYEAAGRIRGSFHPQGAAIPIIAMSANTFSDDVHEALESGMNAHVGKPIEMEVLAEVLSSFL
ncbi:ATP-binding protein [Blautia schinkii]|nr:ATP-binding protein [Blautia schinkii]